MKAKVKKLLFTCLKVLLIDIGFVTVFLITAILSGEYSQFAAIAYIELFLYPILRGVLSYVFVKQVWLPNLIFLFEVFIVPSIWTGHAVFTSFESLLWGVLIFSIPVAASLITAAIVRSGNSQKNTADVPLYKDDTQQ